MSVHERIGEVLSMVAGVAISPLLGAVTFVPDRGSKVTNFRPLADGRDNEGKRGRLAKLDRGNVVVPTGGSASFQIEGMLVFIEDFRVRSSDEPDGERHRGGAAIRTGSGLDSNSLYIGPEEDGNELRLKQIDASVFWENDQPPESDSDL